jgi:ribosomal protein S27E
MGITEKAAYIKGLFEGYEIDAAKKEGKIISEMLTLIADMADEISALKADNRDLHEYVEELDHDLGELEEEIYFGDDYDEEEDYDDYDEEDSDYYEIECPSCGEIVCFDDSLEEDELVCPACGELVTGIEICDGDCSNCSADCDAE